MKYELKNTHNSDNRKSFDYELVDQFAIFDYENILFELGMSKNKARLIYQTFNKNYGKLTCNQFIILYNSFNENEFDNIIDYDDYDGLTRKQVSNLMFKLFDLNRDNYLTIHEFISGFAVVIGGSLKNKLEYAFKMYDIDNDGLLTKHELKTAINDIFYSIGLGNIDEIDEFIDLAMQILDSNNNGQVSKEQFVKTLLKDDSLRDTLLLF